MNRLLFSSGVPVNIEKQTNIKKHNQQRDKYEERKNTHNT